MAIQGRHRDLYGRFKFRMYINGFQSAAFAKCSGLSLTTAKIEYREGGALVAFKEPGLVEYEDLSFERGISQDEDFYQWVLDVVDVAAALPGGIGLVSPGFKKDLLIHQMERDNTPVVEWRVYSAFPLKFVSGEFDNHANEVTIESLTACYHYWERRSLGQPTP